MRRLTGSGLGVNDRPRALQLGTRPPKTLVARQTQSVIGCVIVAACVLSQHLQLHSAVDI